MLIWRLILLCLLLAPGSAVAGWKKAVSDHFIVYGDTENANIREIVEHIEHFDAMLRQIMVTAPQDSPNKLTIFLVRDTYTVQRVMGPNSRNVYGFYRPGIAGSNAVVPLISETGGYDLKSEIVLFHEYAHHFMLQHFTVGYPAWYVEGFAEYYSTTEFRKDGGIAVGVPAKHRFASLIFGQRYPLTRLFADDQGKMTEEDVGNFYAYAWLLTHYLQFNPARKGQMTKYLKAFASGVEPIVAATSAFGDLKTLQRELDRYQDNTELSYHLLSGMRLPNPGITVEDMSDADSRMMPLWVRFATGSRDKDQLASFVKEARVFAGKFPNEPRAYEMLAEGELYAEQPYTESFAAATKANDALLALRPLDARALLRRARIASAVMHTSSNYPGGWKAIRSLIVKANHAAPEDPFPLMMYFNSFIDEGIEPTQVAAEGLGRALELAPQVSDLRFLLADWFIARKQEDRLREVLEPIVNDPHNAEIRTRARQLMNALSTPTPAAAPASATLSKTP